MKFTKYIMFSILLISLFSTSQVFALEGTNVWKEESQIMFEYDYIVEWHEIFTDAGAPNYNLNDVLYKISYIGIYEDNMFFKKESDSSTLTEAIGLDTTNFGEDLIDPVSGDDIDSEQWGGYFYDTSQFVLGLELTDIKFSFEYIDNTGNKAINEKFTVTSQETVSMKIDSVNNVVVDAWKLTVEDFEIKFDDLFLSQLSEFTYSFKNIYYVISAVNGVILEYSQDITLLVETDILLKEAVNMIAFESKNVNLDKSQSSGINGFELYVSLLSIGTILLLRSLRNKN